MNVRRTLQSLTTGLLLLACAVEGRSQALNLTVLHQFTAGNNDGASPYSELTQGTDGVLYGTTWAGGTNAAGIVFRINQDGSGFSILHHFGGAADGSTPFDGVIQASDGFLYGTTYYGGTNSNGTIFKINTNASFYSVLYRFTNSPDGANPYGGLVQGLDGALYGTTYGGGSGPGTVFKINTNGSGYSVLHSFTNFTDATQPFGRLVQGSNGLLYGTTYSGGPNILGTVFQMDTNGSNYGIIHGFGGVSEGFSLECGVILGKDGWLYGTTISGGDGGYGTIFKLNTNGSVYATLRSFTNSPDGANGYARLAQGNDGFLYGTTAHGGATNNAGTIFRLNTNGANYSVLYRFNGNGDGKVPMAGMFTTGNGVFYGMTLMGGATNGGFGTIYRFAMVPVLAIDCSTSSAPLLTLNGFANQSCRVQVSSDMVHWSDLANVSLTNGTAQVPDSNNAPARFYRALIP